MGILLRAAVESAMTAGEIKIDPFEPKNLGVNSYDVRLGDELLVYEKRNKPPHYHSPLDCKAPEFPTIRHHEFREKGTCVLMPGTLYLGSTIERTVTKKHVPIIWGKSTLGRLGLNVHATAGFGDVGFDGHWTLELFVVHPVRVYAGQKIAQVVFVEGVGEAVDLYSGRYQGSRGVVAARNELKEDDR